VVAVKDLRSGEQHTVAQVDVVRALKEILRT
jgi:hypothetical protein